MKNNKVVSKWRHNFRIAGMALIILLLFVLISCTKLTIANYNKLKVGMDYSKVVELLGEPKVCSAVLTAKDCTWGDEKRSIKIQMIADKVIFLSAKGI